MLPSAKILNWLRSKGIKLSEKATIKRTYAGVIQRNAGAISWYVYDGVTSIVDIVGFETLKDLARCPNLILYNPPQWMGRELMCNCAPPCCLDKPPIQTRRR